MTLQKKIEGILEKNLGIISNHHKIPAANKDSVTCWLEVPPGSAIHLQNVYLNRKGEGLLRETISRIAKEQHEATGMCLDRAHDEQWIRDIVVELIQNSAPNFVRAATALAAANTTQYLVAVALDNAIVSSPTTLGPVRLIPPGLAVAPWSAFMSAQTASGISMVDNFPWAAVEVRVYAGTEMLAYNAASEVASQAISFLGSELPMLARRESARLLPHFLVHEVAVNTFRASMFAPRNPIVDPARTAKLDALLKTVENLRTTAPDLHHVLMRGAQLLYRAKTTRDDSSKILMLTAALETLLLEKDKMPRITETFTLRLRTASGSEWKKAIYLADLYPSRCAIVHAGRERRLDDWEYHHLEHQVMGLIFALAQTGKTSHADALEAKELLRLPPRIPLGKRPVEALKRALDVLMRG